MARESITTRHRKEEGENGFLVRFEINSVQLCIVEVYVLLKYVIPVQSRPTFIEFIKSGFVYFVLLLYFLTFG